MEYDGYVDIGECAKRLNLTTDQIMELVRRRVLGSVSMPFGEVWVEPALTNIKP
jgi:hypothetical protein